MRWRGPIIAFALTFVAVANSGATAHATMSGTRNQCPQRGSGASPETSLSPPGPYEQAVDAAAQRGLHVWIEADLAKRWWRGKESFDAGVQRLADLGRHPGVAGFKIADELGYTDSFQTAPACELNFLRDAAKALHKASPGRKLLADFVVPELGCAPGVGSVTSETGQCRAAARAKYPAITLDEMDKVVRSRALDAIDLSTGLLDAPTYQKWGIDELQAQQAAWREVTHRGWKHDVQLNARKALAHAGEFQGGEADATADASVFIDAPRRSGAVAVDVWTWRQQYKGDVYRLMDPGVTENELWKALREQRDNGAALLTHFSPSSVERDVGTDLDEITRVFTGVFVASGTG